jgi:hypothetical protein
MMLVYKAVIRLKASLMQNQRRDVCMSRQRLSRVVEVPRGQVVIV